MSENVIELDLPPGAKLFGYLYDDYSRVALMDQDIIHVSFPNGVGIDVGWYPSHERDGRFRTVVYRYFWENKLYTDPTETRDPKVVAAVVERLAREYATLPLLPEPDQSRIEELLSIHDRWLTDAEFAEMGRLAERAGAMTSFFDSTSAEAIK